MTLCVGWDVEPFTHLTQFGNLSLNALLYIIIYTVYLCIDIVLLFSLQSSYLHLLWKL